MNDDSGDRKSEIAAHLRALEESLLDPAVRRDRARLRDLLADDFLEFGSSGRIWTRNTIIELLSRESSFVPPAIEEFRCSLLSDNVALIGYLTVRSDPQSGEMLASLRSSIWVYVNGAWRMRFHQGTRTVP